jgi:hypothetical protein
VVLSCAFQEQTKLIPTEPILVKETSDCRGDRVRITSLKIDQGSLHKLGKNDVTGRSKSQLCHNGQKCHELNILDIKPD